MLCVRGEPLNPLSQITANLIRNKMSRQSKIGACSANVQAAKRNCLQHDRREGKIPSNVNPELTHDNRTVFEDEAIMSRKSIYPLVKKAEKLYTELTGQKCQKSFTPFREDVLVIKDGITDEQLLRYKEKVEQLTGWKVMGIWVHKDEGHARSKFIEGVDGFKINHHAHVLYDCQDHATGKAIRCTKDYFRKRQDILSECTGMERGTPAIETGKKHRKASEQRIAMQEQRIEQLQNQVEKLQNQVEKLSIRNAAKEKALGWFGKSEKDNTIKELYGQIESLQSTIKAEREGYKVEREKTAQIEEKKRNDLKEKINQINKKLNEALAKAKEYQDIMFRQQETIGFIADALPGSKEAKEAASKALRNVFIDSDSNPITMKEVQAITRPLSPIKDEQARQAIVFEWLKKAPKVCYSYTKGKWYDTLEDLQNIANGRYEPQFSKAFRVEHYSKEREEALQDKREIELQEKRQKEETFRPHQDQEHGHGRGR